MAESERAVRESKPGRNLWIRVLACLMALIMLLSLFMLDAVRIKLGHDAKVAAAVTGAEALAENSEYIEATTPERVAQWLYSVFNHPDSFDDYYQIASILIAQGEYAKALPSIGECIRRYEGGEQSVMDELYMKQGSLHAMLGAYDDMEQSFTHISAGSGYHAQKLLLIAQAAIEQQDVAKAIAYLREYIFLRPDEREMRLALAQLYVASEDYENASNIYGDAIEAGGDADGTLHFLRGVCNMDLQEYALALDDFLEARTRGYADAALCSAQCSLCSFLCAKYEDCITYGEEALAGDSEVVSQPDLCYYMGLSAMTLNLYEQAIGYYARAAEQESTRQDAKYYTAICLMTLSRQEEAVEHFTALIGEGYSLSLCYYNRAACYVAMRKYALAKTDLREVIDRNEDEDLVATAQALLEQL